MRDVVIASAVRTPIGSFGGTLKNTGARTLGAIAIREAIKRAGIDPAAIDAFFRAAWDRTLRDRRPWTRESLRRFLP